VLTVVDGKLLNSMDVGNAVATLLMQGMPIDEICAIEGMPTPVQIAYMRKYDAAFGEALRTAFEGAGIECAFILMRGARNGRIGKMQTDAAMWVAERMAPELFQERKTVTSQEIILTDDELRFQLAAAARSDERVRAMLADGRILDAEVIHPKVGEAEADTLAMGQEVPKEPLKPLGGRGTNPERVKRAMKILRRIDAAVDGAR